ncbi:MAG TPA: hypothetical protein VD906_09845 [Caulobacteraceae bacterium]|nr:hypothetical protein [Caulobacteraceae bacterium]
MIELASEEGDLVPSSVPTFVSGEASRVAPALCLARSNQPLAKIESLFADYPLRYAVGAAAIWESFPEYRHNFFGTVRRYTRGGPTNVSMRLGSTAVGDKLVDRNIFLPSRRVIASTDSGVIWTQFVVDLLPKEFEYLDAQRIISTVNLINCDIYFVDSLSFFGSEPAIFSGCVSLTPEEFFENTNIKSLLEERARPHHPSFPVQSPFIPEAFAAALVLPRSEGGFNDIVVGRVMAAAALSSGAKGKIISQLHFTEGGWGSSFRGTENWYRPYADRRLTGGCVCRPSDHVFSAVATLIESTSLAKFVAGKEDFRLLALDTIEDSRRSGIAPLQVAQIWMAIERLMPFRMETTVQLALSLSAFSDRSRRVEQFNAVKSSYSIRSKIVHGYSFERSQNLHIQVEFLSDLFRRLFLASLDVKTSDDLRSELINHALSGQEAAFPN